ncbi:unnamed protein product [Sympodiomycopsis kandeliae]
MDSSMASTSTLAPSISPSNSNGGLNAPSTSAHRHPIHLKLQSILSTRTTEEEDEKTRDALAALEQMYPANKPHSQHRSSKKNRKPSTSASLIDVDRARSNLESDAKEQMLDASNDFIQMLSQVEAAMTEVQDHIVSMSDTCDDLDDRLTKASNSTRYLLEQAQGLQRQETTTAHQRAIIELFLQTFTTSVKEDELINNREVNVGSRLFATMDRLTRIRLDCRALLEGGAGVGGGTRLGTDIMSSTGEQLDKCYEKIAKYVNFQFRQAPREGMDVSRTVKQCVARLLAAREDLLRPALQTLVSLRSSFLTTSFQQALTSGSSGSRPIELQAHDPLRYVGDMLAWIHQTVASEREFYGQLFNEEENQGGRHVGQRRRGIEGSVDWTNDPTFGDQDKKQIYFRELLDRSLEGCCKPLSNRVESTLRSQQEGPITTFRLANLIQFYKVVMDNTIGSKASVSKMLTTLSQSSYDTFFITLDKQGQSLSRYIQPPDSELNIPAALEESTAVLGELLSVHQSTSSEAHSGISESIANFNEVVKRLLTPMMDLVRAMEDALVNGGKGGDVKRDAVIFRINCAEYIQNTISHYNFVTAASETLSTTIEAATTTLIEYDTSSILTSSGLSTPSSSDMTKVLENLSNPSLLSTPSYLSNLHSPSLRASIHHQALKRVLDVYEDVWKESNGLGEMRSVEEMKMLFGV